GLASCQCSLLCLIFQLQEQILHCFFLPLFKMITYRVSDIAFVIHTVMIGVVVKLQLSIYTCTKTAAEGNAIGSCAVVKLIPLLGELIVSSYSAEVRANVSADRRNSEGILRDGGTFESVLQNYRV